MGQMKLFDDDDNDDVLKIEINQEYAKRLEHNKRREELQRYEEMKKKGLIEESDEESDDESSESEDDSNDVIGNSKKDLKFFKALLLVKKQDSSLREKDIKLFESDSDRSEGEEEEEESETMRNKEKEKTKAMYLKDVMAKHLIEEGPEFQEEKEDLCEKKKRKKSYIEEQEEMRKEFLDAVKEAERNEDEEDNFLKEKKRENDGKEDVDDADNEVFVKKLDEYFGMDGELDENNMFLKKFFKNKMWIGNDKKDKEMGIDEKVEDLLREDEELEKQELYETTYRHEEKVDDRVMGHSRKVEWSVRKTDNARKEQRKSKEERMKIAEMERKEELKHLKNLKKKEMKERMKKVMAIAGFNEEEDLPLNLKDLDDEFDPEEYDRMMKTVFDEKYYGTEDRDPQFGCDRDEEEYDVQKPDFDKEDELLGLPKGWDVIESGNGFKAARERSLKHKLENGSDDDEEEEESSGGDDEEEESVDDDAKEEKRDGEEQKEVYEESKRKRKRKMSLVNRAREEMLEEFYKLDYEDTIGDLKTRFKYAKVKPNKYGLQTEEILMMDDKDLNQYVSVKKLAPYREKEWKVVDSKRYQQKLKNKELAHGQKSDVWKRGKKRRLKEDRERLTSETGAKGDEKAEKEETNGDAATLSKRAKTRRRQAKSKLSHSRLIAYGKISSKTRSKH